MVLQCLLVDDEPQAVKLLESYIQPLHNLNVSAVCQNALEARAALQQGHIDVMFLDISMPKLLGTEFLRTIRNPPRVIFTTAYKEYALEGFELEAVDYLLKPISMERFLRAVDRLLVQEGRPQESRSQETRSQEGSGVVANLPPPFLYFQSERKMVKVLLDDILYIESRKDYIMIVRATEKPLVVKQSIGSLEMMLPDHLFLRIHRSYIVSISKVTAFSRQDLEIGGVEIPIGRLYAGQISRLTQK